MLLLLETMYVLLYPITPLYPLCFKNYEVIAHWYANKVRYSARSVPCLSVVNQIALCVYSWSGAFWGVGIHFQLLSIQEQFYWSYNSRPLHQLGCSTLVMGGSKCYNRCFAHHNTFYHHTLNSIESIRETCFNCSVHCQFTGHMHLVCKFVYLLHRPILMGNWFLYWCKVYSLVSLYGIWNDRALITNIDGLVLESPFIVINNWEMLMYTIGATFPSMSTTCLDIYQL